MAYKSRYDSIIVAIVDGKLSQPLWGIDLLTRFGIKLDFAKKDGDVAVSQTDHAICIAGVNAQRVHPVDKLDLAHLREDNKRELKDVLVEFADVFSRDANDIGRTGTIKHRIILTDDEPVRRHPYRMKFRLNEQLEEEINRLLDAGLIRPSTSPYASPVFFVDKDHGKAKRLVADYRALNAKTKIDSSPMPHPEDVFGGLAGMKVFAKLDITSMFNQIEVESCDIEKTAIITPLGLFEYPVMPFGLVNAPATATRLMREVLRDLNTRTCFVYVDDIIVFASDVAQLIHRCRDIFTRLRSHNLKLKPGKCQFATESLHFLGHIITSDGVHMDPERSSSVSKFPVPRNHKDVRSFLGLCNYNRKFIRDFAKIAAPLHPLSSEKNAFVWSTEAQVAFEALKLALTSTPVLVHFNPEAEHELRTDASAYAIGAVLYQKHQDPKQCGVITYFSKALDKAQRNYPTTERELLAAHMAVKELQHYLYGKRFTLVTDHQALKSIRNQKDPHQRLARMIADLQGYDFTVVYKSGKEHLDADCMSRLVPDDQIHCKQDELRVTSLDRVICNVIRIDNETEVQDGNSSESLRVDTAREQREDQLCRTYIDVLESTLLTSYEKERRARNFTIQAGLLYRTCDDKRQLVVPARRRAAVLLSCHDVPLAGHLGFARTLSMLADRYYWPKMRRDVKRHVASCVPCQMRKPNNTRRQGFTKPLPVAEEVFDTVGIDLIVRLPHDKKRSVYYSAILMCSDHLSKYVIAVPLRDEKAETIIHAFFNHVIAKFGCPRLVISDRGSNISGEESKDFFKLFGIERQLTSAYRPQSNGQTERVNRTLKASLTAFVQSNQLNWSDYLQAIVFAYNITAHTVTRVTPYEMVFGRRPRIPIDNIMSRNEFIDPLHPAPGALSSETVRMLKQHIVDSQQRNKERLDRNLRECTFKEGDLVLIERPTRMKGAAMKLSYQYIGPYKITKRVNDLSFEIQTFRGPNGTAVVHPHHMRHYIDRVGDVADERIDPSFIPHNPALDATVEEHIDDSDGLHDTYEAFDVEPDPHDTTVTHCESEHPRYVAETQTVQHVSDSYLCTSEELDAAEALSILRPPELEEHHVEIECRSNSPSGSER